MATIEKLIKAFEALKVFQPATSAVEEVVRKKEQPISKKDKISNSNLIADCICAQNMRSVSDFPKFLGIAMETFLVMCDDTEADIRMVADECLNRCIKTLMETNLGRLQVELYKEIKKNGSSRCLRAALWRFAEMAHLIRPQKCRPYIVNLLPCLSRICKREEEGTQETLLASMQKIAPALMVFANDAEIKMLLKAFLPNLHSSMASCRRTAATSLNLICQYSRNPTTFFSYLLANLLDIVLPVDSECPVATLVGVVLCVRSILPQLCGSSTQEEGLRGSFGVMKQQKEETISKEQVLKIYQLLLHHTGHADHNVVNASLEALQQLLKTPPPGLVAILTCPGAVSETLIYQKDMEEKEPREAMPEVPSISQMSDGPGLEDESEMSEIASQSAAAADTALLSDLDTTSDTGSVRSVDLVGAADGKVVLPQQSDPEDVGVMFTADSAYSNVEIGDLQEEKSERSNLSNVCSSSQETLLSIKSLSPGHQPQVRPVSQDLNGNPELFPETDVIEPSSPMPMINIEDILAGIGSMTGEEIPLLYCVRLICRRFLLTATKHELVSDKIVRVSVKALALNCIGSAVSHHPEIFLESLFLPDFPVMGEVPAVRDILRFATHSDPQLKGHTTIAIGTFINTVLTQGRGDFNQWLRLHSQHRNNDSITIERLVELLIYITEDQSSVAARLALSALKCCLPKLMSSHHSDMGLRVLLKLLQIRTNTYWLVKVELLELLQGLDFKVVHHLQNTCDTVRRGSHHFLGRLDLQERVLEDIVLNNLGDEDSRVRQNAATTLVKFVSKLYYPIDCPQQDPIVAISKDCADHFLTPVMHDWCQQPPPLVQGLVRPYHVTPDMVTSSTNESSLSRIVKAVLYKLHMSQSKHLTSGCCLALCLLSEAYMTSCYPHAWGCGVPTPLQKETSNRMKRPPTRSLSASSTFSLDEVNTGSGGGPLPIILSLLTSSAVALDLSAHQTALQLAGNLLAGAAYKCLRPSDEGTRAASQAGEETVMWNTVSDRVLVTLLDQLLIHIARVLNALSHVIDEQMPGPPQMKTSLPSLPNAPSISPIKSKVRGDKEQGSGQATPTQDGKANQKKTQKEKDKEAEKERNRKDALGVFYSNPHYVKLFEVLKGSYSNYKISLDLTVSDKFCSMLKTTLRVLSQILEIATLSDIGKMAEEFLNYLRTTVSLEPTDTVLCVQQLLKALFGTNLCSQWEDEHSPNLSRRPGKATRMTSAARPGLYHCTFTAPYSQFTQCLAGATIKAVTSEHDDTAGVLAWMKKCVERKVPAILKPSSKADKTAIAAYIRLFEPLVIKALKQYTVTSSLELQQQVLDLLAQLVQLRVNYCLLDSDQVFIGFVIKQFEYIEEGQIRNSEILIPNIFNFLVMLSYEKFHSKTIIGMPKIIQLCDGIMASGLHPTTHAIPALRPIVHDLFLLRGASKSDISKELETQREVLVSMLLRLIQYYQALDMFVIILQQCHKESEERWKRLSRQVTDVMLPALARQQINLNSQVALDVVHRLFEAVAPIVFRPVDILLKTLLMMPAETESCTGLERWMSLILAVLRVLMAQSKEEVILSRIQELGLKLHVFKVPESDLTEEEKTQATNLAPEEIMACFILQIIGKSVSVINEVTMKTRSCDFLCQQLSHLLMYITHMFQSGLFRRVATAAMKVLKEDVVSCFYGIKEINQEFLLLGTSQPTLTLQWCHVLILLNFSDQTFWSEIVKTPKKYIMAQTRDESQAELEGTSATVRCPQCCSQEVLRRGGLILFCDYACENLNDSEHMTWVLINHVSDLIELSQETPVQDFISAIHRNPAASSLFIQAIHARWENVSRPSAVRKTLKCLEAIHLSQSGALLTLLIDKFLNTHHLAVARICDSIACRRVELLLAHSLEERIQQLPLDDLDKLLNYMQTSGLTKRHERLTSLLCKFRDSIYSGEDSPLSADQIHPLSQIPAPVSALQLNKECYVAIVKEECFCGSPNARECAFLLQHLDYADMLMITMTKEFQLSVLEECLSLGAFRTLQKYHKQSDALPSDSVSVEWTFDPLFQASQLTLIRHINNIINMLPVPHQILTFKELSSVKVTRYVEKLEDFFTDNSTVEVVFQLASSLLQYLVSMVTFPWQPSVPKESQSDICRFCTLCMELLTWMFYHDQLPTSEQLETSLQCVSLVLQNEQLATLIGHKDHVTWVCSITWAVHQVISSLDVLPGQPISQYSQHLDQQSLPTNPADDLHQLTTACDQITALMQYLEARLCHHANQAPSLLPTFLQSLMANIIRGLSRVPVLNSFARVPPVVWKMGWIPTPSGEPKTKLPPLPIDFLLDKDVLRQFVFRINSIGWISRQQFEETWMCLLGVLNPASPTPEHIISPEEEIERTQCMVYTVRAITAMLVQTMLVPTPGNPARGTFDIQPRDKPLGFLHTRCGKKLTVIRGIVEQEVQTLSTNRFGKTWRGGNRDVNDKLKYMFDNNLERDAANDEFMLGQICVESIWSVVGVLDTNLSESDTTDSMESPTHQDVLLPTATSQSGSGSASSAPRDQSSSLAGLDVHSCLQFLLELYRQWLIPTNSSKPPLMLLNEVVKSVVSLSDLFAEREQFEWMLDTMFEVYKAHPGEDEIALQYLNIGICKAAAVVGVDSTTAEKLCKIIDNGLKSTHLSSKVATLYGILYLLEAGIPDVNKLLVPLATEFLLRNIVAVSQQCISSQRYILTMWASAFYIMENYHVDLKDLEFPSKILQLAVSTASGSEDSVSTVVYLSILKGLERLLLTDVLSAQDAEAIVKLSVDRLCLPSPQRSLAALGLLFTCMYSGKQYDQYSPRPRGPETMFNMEDPEDLFQDPESLILAMERITVLFERIKKGYPYEARVITRVLPAFLADFFPPQDIMNKVIGEFISSQQPYPQLIARVVFQVFSNLHDQRQQGLLKNWVMLSLSNFTQRTPVAMAMWSLTCFFISASTNPWLQNLLPYVLCRMGKIDDIDRKLFCLSALDFYSQLTEESHRRAFLSTFQSVAASQPDSPYNTLLSCLP